MLLASPLPSLADSGTYPPGLALGGAWAVPGAVSATLTESFLLRLYPHPLYSLPSLSFEMLCNCPMLAGGGGERWGDQTPNPPPVTHSLLCFLFYSSPFDHPALPVSLSPLSTF